MEDGNKKKVIRLTIVGGSKVGKTAIFKRCLNQEFNEEEELFPRE